MSSAHPFPPIRFVIPAYNEADNLPHLLASIRKFLAFFGEQGEVWVVDDGSTDATGEVVRHIARTPLTPCPVSRSAPCRTVMPIHLVQHTVNRGPGAAFRSGFAAALDGAPDHGFLITIEADNTSDLTILSRMLEQARRGNDVVLASVYGEGRVVGAPLERKMLSWGANVLVRTIFGFRGLHTFSSFFRLYRVSVLRQAFELYGDRFIEEPGFVCMVETLVKLKRMGARMSEVPMLLDANIRIGDSKMKIFRTVNSYLRLFYNLGLLDRGPSPGMPVRRAAAGPGPDTGASAGAGAGGEAEGGWANNACGIRPASDAASPVEEDDCSSQPVVTEEKHAVVADLPSAETAPETEAVAAAAPNAPGDPDPRVAG